MRYSQLILDLFGFGREQDDPAPSPDEPDDGATAGPARRRPEGGAEPRATAPVAQRRRERFDERLRAFAKPGRQDDGATGPAGGAPQRPDEGGAQLVAGRLRMIALDDIRARVGDRWLRLEAKIHGQIRRVLERRLAEADVYQELGEDAYMILFAGLSPEEAAFKAQVIAREIATRLIGDVPEAEGFELRTAVHAFAAAELGQTPDLAALAAAFESRGDDAAAAGGGERRPGVPDPPAGGPAPVRLAYLPVWSRRGKAIAVYQCVPLRRPPGGGGDGGDGGDGQGEERLYPGPAGEADGELDHLVLRSVADEIAAMQLDGRTALVVAPLFWETLASRRRRREYLDLCRELPPDLTRQLCFAVFGVPAGLWQTAIVTRVAPLAPFSRFLLAHVGSDLSRPGNFANTPVQALVFDAGGFDPRDGGRRRAVEGFVRQAHAHRMAVGALWVGSRAGAEALRKAGVDLLAGAAVAALADRPGAAYKLHLAA